jgi:hypothetical protein
MVLLARGFFVSAALYFLVPLSVWIFQVAWYFTALSTHNAPLSWLVRLRIAAEEQSGTALILSALPFFLAVVTGMRSKKEAPNTWHRGIKPARAAMVISAAAVAANCIAANIVVSGHQVPTWSARVAMYAYLIAAGLASVAFLGTWLTRDRSVSDPA